MKKVIYHFSLFVKIDKSVFEVFGENERKRKQKFWIRPKTKENENKKSVIISTPGPIPEITGLKPLS